MNLKKISLTKDGQTQTSEQMLAEIQTATQSPIVRYAYLKSLIGAAEQASKTTAIEAVQEAIAQHPEAIASGRKFEHEGYAFRVQTTHSYDFSVYNQWVTLNEKMEALKGKQKLLKEQIAQLEDKLVSDNRLQPQETKRTIVFLAR